MAIGIGNILDRFFVALGFQVDTADLDKFQTTTEQVRGSALELADVVGGVLAGGFAMFFKSFIDKAAEFEKFAVVLGVLDESAEKGHDDMEWISEFAAHTPYQLEEMTEAFIKLKTFGIDPMGGALTTVGDAAAAMGKPLEEAVGALNMATFGIYRSLRTFGIQAKQVGQEVVFTYLRHGKQMQKAAQANNKAMIAATIEAIWNEKYGGSMEKLSHTWIGIMSNIKDQITRFKERVMNSGPFKTMEESLLRMLKIVDRAFQSGEIDRIANGIGIAFEAVYRFSNAIFTVFDFIVSHTIGWKLAIAALSFVIAGVFISSITNTIALIWKLVAGVLAFDLATVGWVAVIALLALLIDDIINFYEGNESVIGQLNDKFPGAIYLVEAAVGALTAAFIAMKWKALVGLIDTVRLMIMYAGDWAAALWRVAVANIAATWEIALIVAAVLALIGIIYMLWRYWDDYASDIKRWWHDITDAVSGFIDKVKEALVYVKQLASQMSAKDWFKFGITSLSLPGGAGLALATAGAIADHPIGAQPSVLGSAGQSWNWNRTSSSKSTSIKVDNIIVQTTDPDRAGDAITREFERLHRESTRHGQSGVGL